MQEGWDEGREIGVVEDALRSLVETIRQRAGLLSIAPLVPGDGFKPDLRSVCASAAFPDSASSAATVDPNAQGNHVSPLWGPFLHREGAGSSVGPLLLPPVW